MFLTDAQHDQLENFLLGSCKALGDAVESLFGASEDDLDSDDFARIDSRYFLCAGCSWWCDMSECNEAENGVDWNCDDCDVTGIDPDEEE